jgi:hypothetical protein
MKLDRSMKGGKKEEADCGRHQPLQLLKKEAGAPQATGRPAGGAGEVEREAEGMAAEEVADAGYAGLVADHAVHLRTVQHLSCGLRLPQRAVRARYCRQSAALDSRTLHPPARRSRRRCALLASLIKRTGILVIGYVSHHPTLI